MSKQDLRLFSRIFEIERCVNHVRDNLACQALKCMGWDDSHRVVVQFRARHIHQVMSNDDFVRLQRLKIAAKRSYNATTAHLVVGPQTGGGMKRPNAKCESGY